MIIVLDTSVFVSGLLKGSSNPGLIVGQVASGRLRIAYDFRIINEYNLVLRRPRFKFPENEIEAIIKAVEEGGLIVNAPPLQLELPDPGDRPFLEVAAALQGVPLVTGNLKHYPGHETASVKILDPAELIKLIPGIKRS